MHLAIDSLETTLDPLLQMRYSNAFGTHRPVVYPCLRIFGALRNLPTDNELRRHLRDVMQSFRVHGF